MEIFGIVSQSIGVMLGETDVASSGLAQDPTTGSDRRFFPLTVVKIIVAAYLWLGGIHFAESSIV